MEHFQIGDIVKLRSSNLYNYAYLITDVRYDEEFKEYYYFGYPIYPDLVNHMRDFDHREVFLFAEGDTAYDIIATAIKEYNHQTGSYTSFCFVLLNSNKVREEIKFAIRDAIGIKGINDSDVVRYDLIESVDECLDAINDLKLLHKVFGDEVYLQLTEIVVKRLNSITVKEDAC